MNKIIIALILGIIFLGLSGCTNQPSGEATGGLTQKATAGSITQERQAVKIIIVFTDGTAIEKKLTMGRNEAITFARNTIVNTTVDPQDKKIAYIIIIYDDGTGETVE